MSEKAIVFTISKHYNVPNIMNELSKMFSDGVFLNADKGNPIYLGVFFNPNEDSQFLIAEQIKTLMEYDKYELVTITKKYLVVKTKDQSLIPCIKDDNIILSSTDYSFTLTHYYDYRKSLSETTLESDERVILMRVLSGKVNNCLMDFSKQILLTETFHKTPTQEDIIYETAKKNIDVIASRGDLEVHNSDEEDFLEIPVRELKEALKAAYNEGLKQAITHMRTFVTEKYTPHRPEYAVVCRFLYQFENQKENNK